MEKHDQHQPTNNNLDHIHGAMAYLMYCIPEYTIVDEHSLRLCFFSLSLGHLTVKILQYFGWLQKFLQH